MNSKRFYEMDFARALPLLFLPFVHFFEEFSWWGYLDDTAMHYGQIFLYLCAFGPSIFMMVLGMNIAFSSHTSPAELARRGVKTLIIAELLNLFRFVIPGMLVDLQGEDWATLDALNSSLWSDILVFAGLAFLSFALMKKIKLSPIGIIWISLVLLGVHMLVSPATDYESTYISELIGNFVHTTENSAFPLLSWLVYPAVGYSVGLFLKTIPNEQDRKTIYNKMALSGLIALFVVCVCMKTYGLDPTIIAAAPANRNITDLFNIVLDISIAFVWFGVMYYFYCLLKSVLSDRGFNLVVDISKAIMIFYIIQWIIVGWAEYLLFRYEETYCFKLVSGVLLPGLVVMIVSVALSIPIKHRLDKRKLERKIAKN